MSHPTLTGKNKTLLENSNEPMIITIPGYDAICIDCNKKYEDLLGYSREELIHKSTHNLVTNNEQNKIFQTHDALSEKTTVWDKMHLVKKNGIKISVLVFTIPLYDEKNNLFAYAHIVKEAKTFENSIDVQNSSIQCIDCSANYPSEYEACPSCKRKKDSF